MAAASRDALERAIRRRQAWLGTLEGHMNGNGRAISILLDEYAKAIIEAAGAGTNGDGAAVTGRDQLNRILADLDRQLMDLTNGASALYKQAFDAMARDLAKTTVEAYAEFGTPTASRMRAAATAFESRGLPGVFQSGHDQWLRDAKRAGDALLNNMRSHVLRAELEGAGQHQLAQWIANDPLFQFENLPNPENARKLYTAGGRLGRNRAMEHRANVIARDVLADVHNRSHEQWSTEAGYQFFVNYNPLDGRTTEICRRASEQPAMTLEEWDASEFGRPRRHYLCRSGMFAVPDELKDRTGEPVAVAA